jgi:hypothetical protein
MVGEVFLEESTAKPIEAESLDAGKRAVYCIPGETNDDLWIFVFEISPDIIHFALLFDLCSCEGAELSF